MIINKKKYGIHILLFFLWWKSFLIFSTENEFIIWSDNVKNKISLFVEGSQKKKQRSIFANITNLLNNKPSTWYESIRNILYRPITYSSISEITNIHRQYAKYRKKYTTLLENCYETLNLCPSEAVLSQSNNAMIKGIKQCDQHYPKAFARCFNTMLAQEKKIYNRGNIVLYHGTTRFNYAVAYLHTKLDALFSQPMPGYLHIRQPTIATKPSKKRTDYLHQGGWWLNFNDRQHLLFCNCALTANLNQHFLFQEDSISFFTQEKNIFSLWKDFLANLRRLFSGKKTKISIKKLFQHYGLEKWYQKHKKKLSHILHFKASGNIMLQIEITPMLAKQALYPAQPIGKRTYLTVGDTKTSDPLTILHNLSKHPSSVQGINNTVWCLILTNDLILDPQNPEVRGNIHFYPYALEEDKRHEMEKAIDDLIASIKNSL